MEPNLVRRAQQGDRGAFDLVVSEVVDRLYSVAYRILRHGPSAEDATQQALVDIWRHLPSLRDPDRFDAWARTGCSCTPHTPSIAVAAGRLLRER